jgi:hypothetical protein
LIRYLPDTHLVGEDGRVLIESLTGWIGTEGRPFAILADAKGVQGTDADYRSKMGAFFKGHRRTASIALVNMGPVIRIVTEMIRIGTGIELKAFADDAAARGWLRSRGIAA